jgi:hypothetical protein
LVLKGELYISIQEKHFTLQSGDGWSVRLAGKNDKYMPKQGMSKIEIDLAK